MSVWDVAMMVWVSPMLALAAGMVALVVWVKSGDLRTWWRERPPSWSVSSALRGWWSRNWVGVAVLVGIGVWLAVGLFIGVRGDA